MQAAEKNIVVPSRKVEGLDMTPDQTLISVESVVWVTATDQGRDIILGPGDSIRFPKRTRAVVGGLLDRGVTVRVDGPAAH